MIKIGDHTIMTQNFIKGSSMMPACYRAEDMETGFLGDTIASAPHIQ